MFRKPEVGTRKGFTLVELAVVIVIIGVLAAFGVPRFLKSVERSKAAEAFQYLSAVRAAQERFLAKNGIYYTGTPDAITGDYPADAQGETLDITQSLPKYFTLGEVTAVQAADGTPTWTMTMTRIVATSSYGAYEVIFTNDGWDPVNGTLNIATIPDINPMGT
ncbi:MAG: prepilin-type N-terminal cleavage/methylation domain-containing protein [Pirellulales bacterium]|nr:prepilin-type N-terminal cleavage/methylation domain-containing protein [Pirellulales bacterium]